MTASSDVPSLLEFAGNGERELLSDALSAHEKSHNNQWSLDFLSAFAFGEVQIETQRMTGCAAGKRKMRSK